MRSEQVNELRIAADIAEKSGANEYAKLIREAAFTIEEMDEKIQSFNEDEALNMERSAAHYNGGWIPCADRLPEEDGIYIIDDKRLSECDWIHTAGFMKSSRSWCEHHGVYYDDRYGRYGEQEKIVAWMPLPAPWKGETE